MDEIRDIGGRYIGSYKRKFKFNSNILLKRLKAFILPSCHKPFRQYSSTLYSILKTFHISIAISIHSTHNKYIQTPQVKRKPSQIT